MIKIRKRREKKETYKSREAEIEWEGKETGRERKGEKVNNNVMSILF